jgi:DNA topoisomerase-2
MIFIEDKNKTSVQLHVSILISNDSVCYIKFDFFYTHIIMSEETTVWTLKEHMQNKEMWIGPRTLTHVNSFIIENNQLVKKSLQYSPSVSKLFDEVITNASDHHTRFPKLVKNIFILYDKECGLLTVRNDGPGIPIYKVEIQEDAKKIILKKINSDQKGTWNPEIICSHPLSGTNLKDREIHITGGVNGAGLKLANFNSIIFSVETIDSNMHYSQIFENGADEKTEPEIINTNNKSYTSISFIPNFQTLGHGKQNIDAKYHEIYERIIQLRAYQIAAYTGIDVYFQNQKVPIKNLKDLGMMMTPDVTKTDISDESYSLDKNIDKPIVYLNIKSIDEKYNWPWQICVGYNSNSSFEQMSIVNGLYIVDGGTNISYICDSIVPYISSKLKDYKGDISEIKLKNLILSNIFVMMCGAINKPKLDSQSKNKLSNNKDQYKNNIISTSDLQKIWSKLEDYIISSLITKTVDKERQKTSRKKQDINKSREAKYVTDSKQAHLCSLFIPEGDSAKGLVHDALTNKNLPNFTYDYYGWFNIGGVPMNARRFVKKIVDPKTNAIHIIRSNKLKNNERLTSLYNILGLDYMKTYKDDDELKSLRYGSVIIIVDQDEDGKGNICTLILNYFVLFWPALLKRGYVKRLNTPIIRVSQKVSNYIDVQNFYTVDSFKTWCNSLNIEESNFKKKYDVSYYKGLASNSPDDCEDIFSNFKHNIITYTYDEKDEKLFEVYLGKDANMRKIELITPANLELNKQIISCSEHLQCDAKSFQRYNLERTLPGMDGLIISRRKIFTSARGIPDKKIKLFELIGNVMSKMGYHHGDKSAADVTIKMGQEFDRKMPLLLGSSISGFGNKSNPNDAGHPRYISTMYNKYLSDLLFPREDDTMLDYIFEEGKRCEPKYYVPIYPYMLSENINMPAHGWKIEIWGRDYQDMFDNTINAIHNRPIKPMNINTTNWRGVIKNINNKIYSVGSWKVIDEKNNIICITELPHGLHSESFCYGDRQKEKKKKELFKNKLKSVSSDEKKLKMKMLEERKIKLQKKKENLIKNKDQYIQNQKNKINLARKLVSQTNNSLSSNDLNELDEFDLDDSKSDISNIDSVILSHESVLNLSKLTKPISDDHGEEHYLAQQFNKMLDRMDINDIDNKYYSTTLIDKIHVEDVDDRSNDSEVEIYVKFDTSIKSIMSKYGNDYFDGITELLHLRVVIHDHLNFIDYNNNIKEYKSYEEIFIDWFEKRKELYIERWERIKILLELKIYYLELIQKYIIETKEVDFRNMTEVESIKLLTELKLEKINDKVITNPGYTKTKQIIEIAFGPESSYNYIFKLNGFDIHKEAYEKRNKQIIKLKNELENHNKITVPFPGAQYWLNELEELKQVIARSLSEGWDYYIPKRKKKITEVQKKVPLFKNRSKK